MEWKERLEEYTLTVMRTDRLTLRPFVQEDLSDKRFEVVGFKRLAQEGEIVFVAQITRGGVVVVKPAAQA